MEITDQVIRLSAVGDMMLGDSSHFLGRGVGTTIQKYGYELDRKDSVWYNQAIADRLFK